MFFSEHEIRNNIKHYEHNNLFPQSFLEKVLFKFKEHK